MSWDCFRRLLAPAGPDPYAGADLDAVRRLAGVLWLVTLALGLALTPLAPPTGRLGAAGWLAFAALAAVACATAWSQLRPHASRAPGVALGKSYAGLAFVASLQWLAGDHHSPYQELYMIWAGVTAVSHPAKRVLPYMLAVALAACSPLVLAGFSGVAAADTAVRIVIWSALALLGAVWMASVRAQRVQSGRQRERALELARVDALTGLPNRRAFDEALELEVARSRRAGRPLGVVVFDLDGFKQINDGFGHLSGDRALREAAAALRASLRRGDACFRWGGDEFALLLPGSDAERAAETGARMAEAVRSACIRPDGSPLTVCWGCAELLEGMTTEDLLAHADLAMMARKSHRTQRTTAPYPER